MPAVRCDDLHPFFDGELPPADADAFREHLGSCQRCQRELGDVVQLQALSSDLAAHPAPATPATVLLARPKKKSFRAAIAGGAAVLAAAAAVVLAVRSGRDGDPFALGDTRPFEARLTHPAARGYRAYDVKRAGDNWAEPVPLAGLARMEGRGDLHGVATGHLLRGERDQAAKMLTKAGGSPDLRSDLAVVALQRGSADEALLLLDGVLEERPGHPQATWNRGLVLRELGLTLAAAEAFEQVVKLREPGWAEEAARRAASLSADVVRMQASWKAAVGAGTAMLTRGELVPDDLTRRHPGVVRSYLYESLRVAPDAERVRSLRPVAQSLDAAYGGNALQKLADRIARSDLRRRAPLAAQYALLAAQKLDAKGTAALLAATEKADFPELRLGLLVHTRNIAQHLHEYSALARDLGDPWFVNIALHEAAKVHSARRPLEAEQGMREALRHAIANNLDWRAALIEIDLGQVNQSLHRVADAWSHAQAAFRISRRSEEPNKQLSSIYLLSTVARLRLTLSLARAYLREASLRAGADCNVGQFVHDTLADLALLELRGAEARRELDLSPECGRPQHLHSLLVRVDVSRLDPRPGDLERVRKDAAVLRGSGKLAPGEALLVDAFEGKLLIEHEGPDGRRQLERTISEAEKIAGGDVDAGKARGQAFLTLALDAGRRGDFGRAVETLAAEAAVSAPRRCAAAFAIDDARSVVAVLSAGGEPTGEFDGARREPSVRWAPRVQGRLLDALRGCDVVDVLARPPVQGRTDLLPPSIAWRFRAHGGQAAAAGAPRRLIVSDVEPPASLGLPRLEPAGTAGAESGSVELRGPSATPSRVLAAMQKATEIEIHAHGLADLALSDASLLVLSPDEDGTYALTASDVRSARLLAAPVVLLAACRGAQPGTAFSAPWSLPLAFLRAGARAVFAAQSDIPDAQARDFFDALRARMRAGTPAAQALRDERQAWRDRAGGRWAEGVLLFE